MKSILKKKIMHSKKGFTLAELLIVIGIIAVLAAIAIPTFSSSMKKANIAVDIANVRAWYAEALVANMTEGTDLPTTFDTSTLKVTGASVTVHGASDSITFGVIYNDGSANTLFGEPSPVPGG